MEKIIKIENISLSKIFSLIITLIASIAAIWSRKSASLNNEISERMLSIEENRKLNENKEKSSELLGNLYDKLMYHDGLYDIYYKISHNTLIWNEKYLQRFIDEFEWLGHRYCNEEIYYSDLRMYSWFFANICENQTIEQKYRWSKNSLSKMCLDLWFSWMWYYFNWAECRVLD